MIGYQTNELPGFFTAETGVRLDVTAAAPDEIVAMFRAHRSLGRSQAMLVVQPPPAAFALPRARVEAAVDEAQRDARKNDIRGAAVTPYLLAAVTRLTGGSSLTANLALLEQNASLAGSLATLCSAPE